MKPILPALALLASTLGGMAVHAEEIAEIGVDWVGNDIKIESIRDPKIPGVTCHLAYFSRSMLDRLSQGNWFEDPSNSAIECTRTGPVMQAELDGIDDGDDVFREGRSLVFKSLRVKRIYDEASQTLVYLAHANELTEGSAKMSISSVYVGDALQ